VLSLFTFKVEFEPAFCAIGDNAARKKEVLAAGALPWVTIVHPLAYVSKSASIGEGTIVMAGAVVQAGARVGRHCIVNTGASVDHDCVVEDYAHLAPGAHLCGNAHVGEGALVAVGVGVAPGGKIPAWSVAKARRLEIEPVQSHG
jgi:sugar O-acyltransferase (sialic acid O-acetyltransferase NeuD family)